MANSKIVWTSDPLEAKRLHESRTGAARKDADPQKQTIRINVDRRAAAKTVTIVSGFQLTQETLNSIATKLKKRCGSGGTVKEQTIEVQGEQTETITAALTELGFRVRR